MEERKDRDEGGLGLSRRGDDRDAMVDSVKTGTE